MPETGFFAQKQRSPTSLGLVILLHAALIAAVVLIKGPAFQHLVDPITRVTLIPDETGAAAQSAAASPRAAAAAAGADRSAAAAEPDPAHRSGCRYATASESSSPPDHRQRHGRHSPRSRPSRRQSRVRRAAQIDPSSQLQPPYPSSELRAGSATAGSRSG